MRTAALKTTIATPVHPVGPPRSVGLLTRLFADILSTAITVVAAMVVAWLALRFVQWGVLDAIWPGAAPEACRDIAGACWAFLGQKYRQILFGIYPPQEQWRSGAACAVVIGLALLSLRPAHWRRWLVVAWGVGATTAVLLMAGGVAGLAPVPTSSWGGLPVTLLLAICALGAGLPLGIALALGRRAEASMPRFLSIGIIEIIRGLPLVSLLFVASLLLPLMLPQGLSINSLLRAAIALTVFSAAYLAEVVRGGLQAIPKGQLEASQALGLSWWNTTRLVILPQAIRTVLAPLTNTAIVMIKNTSLVLIIGLFDLLSSGRAALTDPTWSTPYAETYLFIASIYFIICFSLSRYSDWLERRFGEPQRH